MRKLVSPPAALVVSTSSIKLYTAAASLGKRREGSNPVFEEVCDDSELVFLENSCLGPKKKKNSIYLDM